MACNGTFLVYPLEKPLKHYIFTIIKISHVSIWKWIQKFKAEIFLQKINLRYIDETVIKTGSSELIWLWIVIEPNDKEILSFYISKERNMFMAELILSQVVNKYGLHSVSSDDGTWYPRACKFLNLYHHLHSSYEKSLIERTMQYIKDRTEIWMITFLVKRTNVN